MDELVNFVGARSMKWTFDIKLRSDHQEMLIAFSALARVTTMPRLLIAVTIGASKQIIDNGYNLRELSR